MCVCVCVRACVCVCVHAFVCVCACVSENLLVSNVHARFLLCSLKTVHFSSTSGDLNKVYAKRSLTISEVEMLDMNKLKCSNTFLMTC